MLIKKLRGRPSSISKFNGHMSTEKLRGTPLATLHIFVKKLRGTPLAIWNSGILCLWKLRGTPACDFEVWDPLLVNNLGGHPLRFPILGSSVDKKN